MQECGHCRTIAGTIKICKLLNYQGLLIIWKNAIKLSKGYDYLRDDNCIVRLKLGLLNETFQLNNKGNRIFNKGDKIN